MNFVPTPDQERFIKKLVATGRYQSQSEVVREGLRMLEDQETLRAIRVEEFRLDVRKGLAEARAGEVVDGPAAMKELLEQVRRPDAPDDVIP